MDFPDIGDSILTELEDMFTNFTNTDGKMSYIDFIAAIIERKGEVDEVMMKKAFLLVSGSEGVDKSAVNITTNSRQLIDNNHFITRQQLYDTIKNSSSNIKEKEDFLKEMDRVIVKN